MRKRLPLLVLVIGAASTFSANVIARRYMAEADFADWAYLTSLVAAFFSFSLLGTEQLIIRSTKLAAGSVFIARQTVRALSWAGAAFAVIYLLGLDGRIFEFELGYFSIPILVAVGAIQVSYQVERTRGRLLASQAALNVWKLALLPAVLLATLFEWRDPGAVAMGAALVLGAVFGTALVVKDRSAIQVTEFPTDAGKVFLPFALSLGTLAILNIVDRVLIERVHDAKVFATYFYSYTILVTPFGLLASYFGFKEAVKYRSTYSRDAVIRDAKFVFLSTAGLVGSWSLACYVLRGFIRLDFDPFVWGCLAALSVLRCVYSVGSAAMGVHGSASRIYAANVITLIGTAVLVIAVESTAPAVVLILLGFSGAWLLRVMAFLLLLPSHARPSAELELAGVPQ